MSKKYIFWGFAIVWMMVMFNLSSDDKEASSYKSRQVTAAVQQLVNELPEDVKLVDSIRNVTEHIVRKTGHVLEYFTLTLLVIIASAMSRRNKRQIFGNAVLIPLLFAISDELHQFYTPGRGPQVTDVAIDSIGILMAITIVFLLSIMMSVFRRFQGEKV